MTKFESKLFKKHKSKVIKFIFVITCIAMLTDFSYGYTFTNTEETLKMVRRIYDKKVPSSEDKQIMDVIWSTHYEHPDDMYDEIMLVCLKYKLNEKLQQLNSPSEKEKEDHNYHYGKLVWISSIYNDLLRCDTTQEMSGYVYEHCTAKAWATVGVSTKIVTVSKTVEKKSKSQGRAHTLAIFAAVEEVERELSNIEQYRDIAVNNFFDDLKSDIDSFLDRTSNSYIRENQFEELLIKLANLVFETKESCEEKTAGMITGKIVTLSLKLIKNQDRINLVKKFAKDNSIEYVLPEDDIEKKKL